MRGCLPRSSFESCGVNHRPVSQNHLKVENIPSHSSIPVTRARAGTKVTCKVVPYSICAGSISCSHPTQGRISTWVLIKTSLILFSLCDFRHTTDPQTLEHEVFSNLFSMKEKWMHKNLESLYILAGNHDRAIAYWEVPHMLGLNHIPGSHNPLPHALTALKILR